MPPVLRLLGCLGLLASLETSLSAAELREVGVDASNVLIRFDATPTGPIAVHFAAVHEDDAAALARPAAWSGTPGESTHALPRFDGPVDRLYQRVVVRDAAGQPLGQSHYVTDLSSLPREAGTLPTPTTPKGLQCIVDLDDAIALGVKHAAVNVSFSSLYDASGESPIAREIDGLRVAAHTGALASLDATVKRMTDAGIRVSLILLNYRSPAGSPPSPLVHPHTRADSPNGVNAFNLTNAEGVAVFRGLVELLAERYSRSDAAHGLVANYIVGNEVQSHYDWYNMGEAAPEVVIAEYARAVRIADLAVRRFHPDARACVSLDHFWMRQHRPEPTRGMPGRVLLDRLHATLAKQGDVPWSVAFHPYPEDLGNPRTWQDETALHSFDTPRITFRNLEVLTTYLRQPHLLVDGEPRRLLLSEQGFHCRADADGETLQAAAYAYAFERVRRIEGIESFIYHRHVDHPGEGGLRLGLRENVPGTFDRPARARAIAEVFRRIDTPEHDAATAFAKPIIGITTWDELAPQPVTDDRSEPRPAGSG